MQGWPNETIAAAKANFDKAEAMLNVQGADEVDSNLTPESLACVRTLRPIYGALQKRVQGLLKDGIDKVPAVYRTEPAPLASRGEDIDGIDFQKFSTPGEILKLLMKQKALMDASKGAPLDIVTDCIVERIVAQNGVATALQTSRGVLPLGAAKLVLAMGTLPPTTLVRNSFLDLSHRIGERFCAHFITSIVARVPRKDLDPQDRFGPLEIGACYVAGKGKDWGQQFHIQLSALSDRQPEKNAGIALRYMPDVVATASQSQIETSKDYIVFVCAVLGELDYRNKDSWFRFNSQDPDPTTNSLLQIVEDPRDRETWDVMDESTFEVLENILSPAGKEKVEYWIGPPDKGGWEFKRPSREQRRVDGLVHESSTLHIGDDKNAPVGTNYQLKGVQNVYITGAALWPQGGSWNPTMTMVALAIDLADRLATKRF
jgi:hypothetical protein